MLKKADLHIHSKYSDQPAEWLLRQIGAPESFTDPDFLYQSAKKRGMDFVTITDHNTIKGVLEIVHHPDVFISVEATAWFPENGCAIHVLCYDISENHFTEIEKLRINVYDLLSYLRNEKIIHSCAHPLYDVEGRLTLEIYEKCILLFDLLEIANGQSNLAENQLNSKVLKTLTPEKYQSLIKKHSDLPISPTEWRKGYTGGSDDHSGLFIARGYTYVKNADTKENYLDGLRTRQSDATSIFETSISFAHGLYYTIFSYYKHKIFNDPKSSGNGSLKNAMNAVGGFLGSEEASLTFRDKFTFLVNRIRGKKSSEDFKQYLLTNLADLNEEWSKEENILDPEKNRKLNERTFEVAGTITSQLVYRFMKKAIKKIYEGSIFGSIQTLASLIPVLMGLAPYMISFLHYNKNKKLMNDISKEFLGKDIQESVQPKKAWVTDTFTDVNGVAVVIKKMAEIGVKHHHDLTIITCTNDEIVDTHINIKNFIPVGDFRLPQNDSFALAFPPFLEMVHYFETEKFTEIIISTPGTVGMAALGAAKLLDIKVSMIYHTDFPGYVYYYTNDRSIEDIAWKFMIWFYGQADKVYVPSSDYKNQLIRKDISPNKLKMFPHGTDIQAFTPAKKSKDWFHSYGLNGEKKVIYVGRVAKEKDLEILPEVWKRVSKEVGNVALVIVGDGPYMNELKDQLKGTKVIFTGFMKGEQLYKSFASSDIFIFPSTTDTFGNVVIEALASGIPAVVSDMGGPKDIVTDGKTGIVTKAKDVDSLSNALIKLLTNDNLRNQMSKDARAYAETQSWESIYLNFWNN